jgi:MFS family permease
MGHLSRDQRLIFGGVFLWGFGTALFLYIQPLYISFLGASPKQIGLTIGISGLIGLLLHVPMAQRADRIGRQQVMLAGWGLGTLATLVMALAPDWRWFIPGLAALQLSNFAMPAFFGYVAASNNSSNPSRVFATISSAASVGSIISPAIGGWIGEQFGLRSLYLSAALLFALSTLMIASLNKQPVISQAQRTFPRQLLANRPFMWQIGYVFLLFFAIDLGQVMIPNFMQDIYELSLGQIGRLGTLGSLGVVLFMLSLSRFPAERRWALLAVQGLALIALLVWLNSNLLPFIALAYFLHGRNRLAQPFMDARLTLLLKPEALNLGYSFREIAMRLGLSVSPYLAGQLYAVRPSWPLYGGVFCLLLTAGLTFTLPADLRHPTASTRSATLREPL